MKKFMKGFLNWIQAEFFGAYSNDGIISDGINGRDIKAFFFLKKSVKGILKETLVKLLKKSQSSHGDDFLKKIYLEEFLNVTFFRNFSRYVFL